MRYLVADTFHNRGVFTSFVGRGNNKHIGRQIHCYSIALFTRTFLGTYVHS